MYRLLFLSFALSVTANERLGPPPPASVAVPVQIATPATAESLAATPDPFAPLPRLDGELTLDQAVAFALEHSPVLAAARSDVEMARQIVNMMRAALLPRASTTSWATYGDAGMVVAAEPSVMPSAIRAVPPSLSWDTNLMLMVPIYTGGRLEHRVGAEKARLAASRSELEAMRLDLALAVRELVRRIVWQTEVVSVYSELVATNEERLRIDRAAFAVGKIPEFNVFRDEASLAEARQMETNAVRDLRILTANLKTAIGAHPASQLTVAAKLEPESLAVGRNEALDRAARQRPELAAVRARVAAARHEERSANGALLPQVNLLAMADLVASVRGMRNEEVLGGVSISLPLFDGGERRSEARRARAEQDRLRAQETALVLQIANEVIAADERRQAAEQNLTTAEQALRSAREDYRIAQRRYAEGKGINVEVLDALAARVRADTAYLAAVYELLSAHDELRRAYGDVTLAEPVQNASG